MDSTIKFRDLPIGAAFSFTGPSLADRHGYVKRSARGWTHPTYGNGRVGSINVAVIRQDGDVEREDPRDTPPAWDWRFDHPMPAEDGAR